MGGGQLAKNYPVFDNFMGIWNVIYLVYMSEEGLLDWNRCTAIQESLSPDPNLGGYKLLSHEERFDSQKCILHKVYIPLILLLYLLLYEKPANVMDSQCLYDIEQISHGNKLSVQGPQISRMHSLWL